MPPDNALRIAPVFKVNFQPIINDAKDGWHETPDHRQKKDEQDRIIEGSGTPYWLTGDTHQSEARYMTELGALPKDALLAKPLIPLVEAKTVKLAWVTQERDKREQDGFSYLGKVFDADATSVQRLTVAGQAASLAFATGQAFEIVWTVQDDSTITMTAEQMLGVAPAIAMHANTLHQEARLLKDAVNVATTLKKLEAITW